MRILALVTDAFGGRGGIAQANRDLLEALGEEHDVTVLPRRGAAAAGPHGVRQLDAPGFGRAGYARAAAGLVSRRPAFDLIFCGHFYMATLAWALSRVSGTRYWLHLHGIEAWPPRRFGSAVSARASLVTAISRYTRRRFLAWTDLDPWRVKVLPDTVDPRFAPGEKPAALAERWGLSGKKVVLTVGRLSASERYKGHDRILSLLPRLLDRHPGLCYLIAGEGGDRPRLEALASSAGLSEHVVFSGAVEDAEMPQLYRLADVFVMPSTGEGFGIAFLEAAASGVPVIGGNADGSVDALREGRLGTLVDPARPEELFAALDGALAGAPGRPAEAARFAKARLSAHLSALLKEIGG
jgi:phosphatidylinositol alpha-1,6-mannosyltransferase